MSELSYLRITAIDALPGLSQQADTLLPIFETFEKYLGPYTQKFKVETQHEYPTLAYSMTIIDSRFLRACVSVYYILGRSYPTASIQMAVFKNERKHAIEDVISEQLKLFELPDFADKNNRAVRTIKSMTKELLPLIPKDE